MRDLLQLQVHFVEQFDAFVELVVEFDGRGGVVEAGHFEELVVVVGIA